MTDTLLIDSTPATTAESKTNLEVPPLEATEEEIKLGCIYNEEVNQIPSTSPDPIQGIKANDIGSLLEQFLEYEQGSDGDNSYPDSRFITPVASPCGSNDDAVLGRLMIVQEKLSQEVEKADTPQTPTSTHEDEIFADNGNNNSMEKLKSDGLIRTLNGIHPKGNNIRMADSPKFAKFKKKKPANEPLLRRTHSVPSTPRCTSPNSEQVSKEEIKRREEKLIETLALTMPKKETKTKNNQNDANTVKRNLNETKENKKRKHSEPVASRLMPVVSKRQRISAQNNDDMQVNDPRLKKKVTNANDPRLVKKSYCETSNITQLLNTNLDQINAFTVNSQDDTTIDDIGIVDMTIDHDALSATIITNKLENIKTENEPIHSYSPVDNQTTVPLENVEIIDSSDNLIDSSVMEEKPIEICEEVLVKTTEQTNFPSRTLKQIDIQKKENQENKNIEKVTCTENVQEDINPKSNISVKCSKPSTLKTPKNYRRMNNGNNTMEYKSSDSEEEFKESYFKRERRKSTRSTRYSRGFSRSRSRSPYNKYRDNSPIPRSKLYGTYNNRTTMDGSKSDGQDSSDHNSGDENIDINNKLSELSNPVPYDIEHERKLQFLVGKTNGRYTERRNIYAGGINRATSKQELIERFRRFGKIERISLHFREKGDNYAFIVYDTPDQAMRAIEEGNDDPSYPRLELCFGGRRRFVGGSYVDFDGNNSYLEETERARDMRCESPEDDFDRLLKMATQNIKRRKEVTPEWD